MSKKALRSVYLDMQQVERLKLLSEKTRVPQAVYIREGLDLVMNKYEKKIRKSPPSAKSRGRNSATLTLLKRKPEGETNTFGYLLSSPLTPTLSQRRLCHNEEIPVIIILNPSPVMLSPSLCHSSMLKSKSLFYMGVDREIIILGIPNL